MILIGTWESTAASVLLRGIHDSTADSVQRRTEDKKETVELYNDDCHPAVQIHLAWWEMSPP